MVVSPYVSRSARHIDYIIRWPTYEPKLGGHHGAKLLRSSTSHMSMILNSACIEGSAVTSVISAHCSFHGMMYITYDRLIIMSNIHCLGVCLRMNPDFHVNITLSKPSWCAILVKLPCSYRATGHCPLDNTLLCPSIASALCVLSRSSLRPYIHYRYRNMSEAYFTSSKVQRGPICRRDLELAGMISAAGTSTVFEACGIDVYPHISGGRHM